MRISIRNMMMAVFLTIILILTSTMGVLSYQRTKRILINQLKEESVNTMENAKHYFIENYIRENEKILTMLLEELDTEQLLENPGDIEKNQQLWGIIQKYSENIWFIYIGTANGDIYVAPQWQKKEGFDPRERPWYKAAVAQPGKVTWCEPYQEYITKKMVVSTCITITNSKGIAGVLSIDTSLDKLSEIVGGMDFGKNSYAMIVDRHGYVIAHPDRELIGKNMHGEVWFKEIYDDGRGVVLHNLKEQDIFINYMTIPETGWKLVAFIPKTSLEKEVRSAQSGAVIIAILGIVLAMIISIQIAFWFTRKINQLIHAMTEVEKGNLEIQCNLSSNTEFTALSHKFNNMVHTLRHSIEQQKKAEHELRILSQRDALTSLYNRNFFEEKIKEFEREGIESLGIMIFDVDGLKLINDTLGHDMGDQLLIEAANIIKTAIPKNSMLFRIGGDEFVAFVFDTEQQELEKIYQCVNDRMQAYNDTSNQISLSISTGFSMVERAAKNVIEALQKADSQMYREKLQRSKNTRNTLIDMIARALETRDFLNNGHGDRMEELMLTLAGRVGYPENKFDNLKLFTHFHDIGKVGVREEILFKKEALNHKEREEINKHSEIGYRIALSAPQLSHVAEWILKHHEWWNGQGYPIGLKEMEIPMECRMLAIADAYDAMTSERPYRRAYSHEEALKEIMDCGGTMFDPNLVSIFVEMMEELKVEGC